MVKKSLMIGALLVAMLGTMIGTTVLAQTFPPKIVRFDINVPYKMRMGNYMLPAGKYILIQEFSSDLNLYSLHPVDLTHGSIAMIRTARVRHDGALNPTPEKSDLIMRTSEDTSGNAIPVVRGWTIAGDDGWEIISVTPKKNSPLVRVSY